MYYIYYIYCDILCIYYNIDIYYVCIHIFSKLSIGSKLRDEKGQLRYLS